jgi:hypothetical protein
VKEEEEEEEEEEKERANEYEASRQTAFRSLPVRESQLNSSAYANLPVIGTGLLQQRCQDPVIVLEDGILQRRPLHHSRTLGFAELSLLFGHSFVGHSFVAT